MGGGREWRKGEGMHYKQLKIFLITMEILHPHLSSPVQVPDRPGQW